MGKEMDKRGLKNRDDVVGYLRKVTWRQIVGACRVLREWNRENPGAPIPRDTLLDSPQLSGHRAQVEEELARLSDDGDERPAHTSATTTAVTTVSTMDGSDGAAARAALAALLDAIEAFAQRPYDFGDGFLPSEVSPKGAKQLDRLRRDLERGLSLGRFAIGDDGTSGLVTRLSAEYEALRLASLPDPGLQRTVYDAAGLLQLRGLAADRQFARVCELFRAGKPDQFKGLVGEYLGAAQAGVALREDGLDWNALHTGVLVLRVEDISEGAKLPTAGGELDHRSAPVLRMRGMPGRCGTVIGEIDTMLCVERATRLTRIVAILESKGGNNTTQAVRKQITRLAENLTLVRDQPSSYCLALREGNEYVAVSGRYDLGSLAAAPIHSTGPRRRSEDHQFDIVVELTPEEVDALLRYLAYTDPAHWGEPPTPPAPAQLTRAARARQAELLDSLAD